MPIPVPDALDENAALAAAKAESASRLPRYLLRVGARRRLRRHRRRPARLAVSAPLVAAGSAAAKLVQGGVFGIALTLVVFAGAELFTGNVMVMLQGWWQRTVTPARGRRRAGRLARRQLRRLGRPRRAPSTPAARSPARAPSSSAPIVAAKDASTGPQLFWRAVLCNALVCLALWMAARTRRTPPSSSCCGGRCSPSSARASSTRSPTSPPSPSGRSRASIGWAALARNLLWTVPGNIVGGGLVIGLGYAWMAHRRPALTPALVTAERTPVTAPEPTLCSPPTP